jgi:chromosome segregation ATPase
MNQVITKINEKINNLLKEQEQLVKEYNMYSARMQEILTRLAQIQGALDELRNLSSEVGSNSNTEKPEQGSGVTI